jgi:hypothetical protein
MSYVLTTPAEPLYATVTSFGNTNPYKENNHCEPSRFTKDLQDPVKPPCPTDTQGSIFNHNPFIPNNHEVGSITPRNTDI